MTTTKAILALPLVLLAGSAAGAAVEGPYTAITGGANDPRTQYYPGNTVRFDDGPLMGVNIGYLFQPGFRPEIELTLRQNDPEADRFEGGDADATAVLANMWIDLPPIISPALRPFFGVGGGVSQIEQVGTGGGVSDSDQVTAYQAGAGLGYDFNPLTNLTVGWRYFATGTPEFESGTPAARYRADAWVATLRFAFGRAAERWIAELEGQRRSAVAAAPAPAPQAEVAALEMVVLASVNFLFDRADLTDASRKVLDELAPKLAGQPDLKLTIEGHTDSLGTDEYNIGLGERRARAVADYLASQGVNRDSMTITSKGENEPIVTNNTPEGRATNRRIEFDDPSGIAGNVKIMIEGPSPETIDSAVDPNDPGPK